MLLSCVQCGKACSVIPARAHTFKFCSLACRGKWRRENWTGSNHPNWSGGIRTKTCGHCGKQFGLKPKQPITTFRNQKFCTKECADKGGLRYEGENHPNYKPDSRRNNRGKQSAWARAVKSRDMATCQRCGISNVPLHAHHIESFTDHPNKRWDVSNGLTLCFRCHWEVHSASTANGVNSGNIRPGKAEDNPEPSLQGNLLEGVTTSGRAYRRIAAKCEFCGEFLSRSASDAKGKAHLFCSKSHAGKWRAANGIAFRKRQ